MRLCSGNPNSATTIYYVSSLDHVSSKTFTPDPRAAPCKETWSMLCFVFPSSRLLAPLSPYLPESSSSHALASPNMLVWHQANNSTWYDNQPYHTHTHMHHSHTHQYGPGKAQPHCSTKRRHLSKKQGDKGI